MASTEQHYSLRWNDHTIKIVTAFQSLRDEEDFVDVTVACDGHHYLAHKMVLSACSPYFRSLLRANPCQHPIVILKDVGHIELERLLEFMYNGEVNIAQDQLAAFLKTAESLKIRGLAGSSDELDQPQQSQKDLHHTYTGCLSGSALSGLDGMSGHSSPSNFSGIGGCKEDLISADGVFTSQSNSPPLKRRKRTIDVTQDGTIGHPIDNLSEANLIEVRTDRVDTSGNGIDLEADTGIERQELKAEPSDHLTEVYADSSDLNTDPNSHHDPMSHRPIIYPMSSLPGPSGTQSQNQQDIILGNSQDSGAALGGAVCEALNLSLHSSAILPHVNGSSTLPASLSIHQRQQLHHTTLYQLQTPSNAIDTAAEHHFSDDEIEYKVNPAIVSISNLPLDLQKYPQVKTEKLYQNSASDGLSESSLAIAIPEYKLKLYPCPECHKVFRHPMSLHHHRHVHKGTYTCHSCGKVFSRRWDLHRHMHRSKMGCRQPNHSMSGGDVNIQTHRTDPQYDLNNPPSN